MYNKRCETDNIKKFIWQNIASWPEMKWEKVKKKILHRTGFPWVFGRE